MDALSPEMHDQEKESEALMHILTDATAEPIMLSYKFLENITDNFSKDHEIGTGGFGVVYMGTVRDRKVAIKKLSRIDDFSEKQFEDELKCLKRVKENIVRFLGYCSDTPKEVAMYNGAYVLAENRKRFLCFEYAPNKSLEEYIKDESRELDWDTRYQLIKGICRGLHYLHNKERINHLDLKPANILLDADMVPKITDFGLSRRFSGEQSRIITEHVRGTRGYIAPEYIDKGEIPFKTDIYSLGIIISKLLIQRSDDRRFDHEGWHKSADIVCSRAKACKTIAQLCVDADQQRRPNIDDIINMLNLMGTLKDNSEFSLEQERSNSLPRMDPRDMHFTSKERSNSVQLPRMDLGDMHFTSKVWDIEKVDWFFSDPCRINTYKRSHARIKKEASKIWDVLTQDHLQTSVFMQSNLLKNDVRVKYHDKGNSSKKKSDHGSEIPAPGQIKKPNVKNNGKKDSDAKAKNHGGRDDHAANNVFAGASNPGGNKGKGQMGSAPTSTAIGHPNSSMPSGDIPRPGTTMAGLYYAPATYMYNDNVGNLFSDENPAPASYMYNDNVGNLFSNENPNSCSMM